MGCWRWDRGTVPVHLSHSRAFIMEVIALKYRKYVFVQTLLHLVYIYLFNFTNMENIFAFSVLIVWPSGLLAIVFFSGVFSPKGTEEYTTMKGVAANLLIIIRAAIFISVPLQNHMSLWAISTLLMLGLDIKDYKYGRINLKFVTPRSKK